MQKITKSEQVFLSPEFWVTADSLYGDHGGFYWLRGKSTMIEREGGNWVTRETYHMQIVVLDASVMEEYADVSLAFGPSSRLSDLRARTITSDGMIFPVKQEDVFEKSAIPDLVRSLVPEMKLDACGLVGMSASSGVVRVSAAYTVPSAATRVNDRAAVKLDFLRPRCCGLADIGTASMRRFPVWLPYGWAEEDTIHLDLPAGWQIERLPQDRVRSEAYGSYAFEYAVSGDRLTVVSRYVVRTGKVAVSELADFRDFWSEVRSIMGEDIILKAI
jgi:hypothetical protein